MKVLNVKLYFIIIVLFCLLFCHSVQAERNSQNASWESLGPEGGWIRDFVQHTSDSNILYALPFGNPARLHKSTNKGDSWSELSQLDGSGSVLAVDPNNSSVIYGLYGPYVYKSIDGGVTWNRNTFPDHSFYGVHVDPINSNILHACGTHYNGSYRCVCYFKSNNGGSSWSRHYPLPTTEYTNPHSLEADPTNSDIVYISGRYYTGSEYSSFVYRSTDGGASWGDVTAGTAGYIYDIVIDPTSGKIYAVSVSGVYRSTNHGNHWDKNNGWAMGSKLAIDSNNPNILFTGDYNRCFKSTDGGVNWTLYTSGLFGGICQQIIVDRGNSNNVFYASAAGFFKSTDGGVTWFPSNSGLLLANITALKLVPTAPTTMYIAFDNNAVYKTNNARGKLNTPSAVIWNRLPEFYGCHNIADFAIPHANPDHIFAMEGFG